MPISRSTASAKRPGIPRFIYRTVSSIECHSARTRAADSSAACDRLSGSFPERRCQRENHHRGRKARRKERRQNPDHRSVRHWEDFVDAYVECRIAHVHAVRRYRGRRHRGERPRDRERATAHVDECRDLACVLGGPNPALPATVAYSEAHHNDVMKNSEFASLASYQILLVDSLTAASRLSFTCAEQQPEAYTDRGRKDLRAIYGLHGRTL